MRSWIVLLALCLPLSACMKSGPAETMETAKFEELQQNLPHARELYERVIEEYPDSPEANEARARLQGLDSSATK
jgi:hypothetical protein